MPIRNLVFEGGGVKGIGYVGALELLGQGDKNFGKLKDVEHVAGASAGAIISVFLGLGYTLKEIEPFLTMDLTQFTDDFLQKDYLFKNFGLNSGKPFRTWVGERIKEKLGLENATFADLHARVLNQQNKDDDDFKFREIHLMGANLSTSQGEIFSYYTTPNMPIADALRISISFPGFFTAKRYKKNDNGEFCYDKNGQLIEDKKGQVYVDGGLALNYPVKIFDNQGYPNPETLGIKVDTPTEINFSRDGKLPECKEINNLLDYGSALLSTAMWAQQSPGSDNLRTVYINTGDIGTLEFDLSPKRKDWLIEEGRKATRRYFNETYNNLSPSRVGDQAVVNSLRLQKRDRERLISNATLVYFKDSQNMMQCSFIKKDKTQHWYDLQDKVEKYYRWCLGFSGVSSLQLHKAPGGNTFIITIMMTDALRDEMNKMLKSRRVSIQPKDAPYTLNDLVLLRVQQDVLKPEWMTKKPISETTQKLWKAVSKSSIKKAIKHIEAGAALDVKTKEKGDSLLHEAAFRGAAGIVRLLIEKQLPVEGANYYGDTPLHRACSLSASEDEGGESVKALLSSGASPNVQTKDKTTPLMIASEDNRMPVVSLLIQYGADVNLKKQGGLTALMLAVKTGRDKVVEMLLTHGANPKLIDDKGLSVLDYAVEYGEKTKDNTIKELIENHTASITNNNNNNNTLKS